MYTCQICSKTLPPHTPSFKIAVETRIVHYPTRHKAHQFWTIKDGKHKYVIKDDPGGVGCEIAREAIACPDCVQKHQQSRLRSSRRMAATAFAQRKSA